MAQSGGPRGTGTARDDNLIAANSFNGYFMSSALELGSDFVERKLPVVLPNEANARDFECVDEEKVKETLSSVSNSRAKDI